MHDFEYWKKDKHQTSAVVSDGFLIHNYINYNKFKCQNLIYSISHFEVVVYSVWKSPVLEILKLS